MTASAATNPSPARTLRHRWDEGNAMVKVNPIIEWSVDDVWAHIKANNIRTTSSTIRTTRASLRPCTRAIRPRGHPRRPLVVENPEFKECGLHE